MQQIIGSGHTDLGEEGGGERGRERAGGRERVRVRKMIGRPHLHYIGGSFDCSSDDQTPL